MSGHPNTSNRPDPILQSVAFTSDTAIKRGACDSVISGGRQISRASRANTDINNVPAQTRAHQHAYIFRRPHTLQHYNHGIESEAATTAVEPKLAQPISGNSNTSSQVNTHDRSTDNILIQLGRLNLFIDLIWIGIVANLSATFSEQAFSDSGVPLGTAIAQYVLLFLPVWRLWDYLRDYNRSYYKDDLIQRNFILWILLLAVLYGINAPYAHKSNEVEHPALTLLIAIYLVARASFLAAYLLQAVYMPFLGREFFFQLVSTALVSAIWVAAIWVPYPSKTALLIVGNVLEHPFALFMASPAADRLLTGGWQRYVDVGHTVERVEGFFIIILGEGVFRLIEGSPSGLGINHRSGTVLTALLNYYILHWLYFNGDHSKQFVHALRRAWWRAYLWKLFHVVMFGLLLILAASVLFLVKYPDASPGTKVEEDTMTRTDGTESTEDTRYALTALWCASSSLAGVLSSMTCIALLNRPLDKPKTLVVNSRWLRLAPRLGVIALIACLPLVERMSPSLWCGVACSTLYTLFFWEWVVGLESDWKLVEPQDDLQ